MTVHLGYINWIILSQLLKHSIFWYSSCQRQPHRCIRLIQELMQLGIIRQNDQVRCLKSCQNESIGDSNAKLAEDLRAMIYTDIIAGKSDQQIITYLKSRYGHFVSYEPPFNWSTLLIWLATDSTCAVNVFYFQTSINQSNDISNMDSVINNWITGFLIAFINVT